jgi:hypothetical protein
MPSRATVIAGRLSAVALLCIGCANADRREETARAPVVAAPVVAAVAVVPQYADTASIDARVAEIDRYLETHPGQVSLYASVEGQAALVPVKDSTTWPDEVSSSYNLGVDSLGRPLWHLESPTSGSGDWYAIVQHWFAPDGRTILYEFRISGFSAGCTDILRETWRVYLDPAGRTLAESRRYTDKDGTPVHAEDCERRSDDAPAPKASVRDLPVLPK